MIVLALLTSLAVATTQPANDSRTAYSELLDYLQRANPQVRPVKNYSDAVTIKLNMAVYQIVDVDETNQKMVTSVWMEQIWYDEILVWNPADYANITTVSMKPEHVWQPDTFLYNRQEADLRTNYLRLTYSAEKDKTLLHLMYSEILETSCQMDVGDFPFDRHVCSLTYGSAIHTHKEIDYIVGNDSAITQFFLRNQEWDLIDMVAITRRVSTGSAYEFSRVVDFKLVLQRKPLFHIMNFVIPSFVLVFVCFVGIFSPSASGGERAEGITLGVTTVLALGVLLLQLADNMPRSSVAIPLMSYYIISQLVLVGMGSVMSMVIIAMFRLEDGEKPANQMVRCFNGTFGWLIDDGKGEHQDQRKYRKSGTEDQRLDKSENSNIPQNFMYTQKNGMVEAPALKAKGRQSNRGTTTSHMSHDSQHP